MSISGQKFRFSSAELAQIKAIQFCSMSEQEIERWTVTEVKKQQEDIPGAMNFDRSFTGDGELCDKRLGINAPFDICGYCGQGRECPGHFGHINLPEHIYHMGFLETVAKILNCICHECSKLKEPISKGQNDRNLQRFEHIKLQQREKKDRSNELEIQGRLKRNLNFLSKLLKNVSVCSSVEENRRKQQELAEQNSTQISTTGQNQRTSQCNCNNCYIKFTKEKYHKIAYWTDPKDKNSKKYLKAEKAYEILSKINEVDCKILGFSGYTKPKDLLIKKILVPPPQVRPSIQFSIDKPASHDDLTQVYDNILTQCRVIKEKKENNSGDQEIQEVIDKMTLDFGRMMDNQKNIETLTISKKKKKVKCIKSRLKGKEGRIRQNIMGKRVDFSARSVISGDANLELDQLGVPRAIAYELTYPVEVNYYNYNYILNLFKQNYIKTVLVPDSKKEKEEYIAYSELEMSEQQLEEMIDYGVIVERYMMDGDFVLFNRQPTLHKMSMMGHRVKVLPGSTFRLNLSVTTPYNADFDGDEMNMHVPQSLESFSELKYLCHVPTQIVTPKANKPVMGIVQDSLLGSCLFTLRDTFLTKQQAMNLTMFVMGWKGELPMPAILKPQPLWTGKQIMSMIIPKRIQLVKPGDDKIDIWNTQDDSTIYIERGELLQGTMNKNIIGDGGGGLIHTVWLDEGSKHSCDFMTQCQRIVNNWLIMVGFTISCSDMVPMKNCDEKVQQVMQDAEASWEKTFDLFQDDKQIEEKKLHKPGTNIFNSLEFEVNNILNEYRNLANKAATDAIPFRYNNFKKMVWSGSKGKDTNLAQVLGVVGQQNVEGKRVAMGFQRRTLPHFQKDTYGLSERGYVKNNFFRGLLPYEFFFHTMGGREGLSDTAVKTANTGYIQRKLVKAIEDVKVCYDGTVRESSGTILETSYGEDGLAGEFIEYHDYYSKKIIPMKQSKFAENYKFTNLTPEQKQMLDPKIVESLPLDLDDPQNQLNYEYKKLQKAQKLMIQTFVKPNRIGNVHLPVDVRRIIRDMRKCTDKYLSLSPYTVIEKTQELIKELKDFSAKRHQKDTIGLFKAHIRFNLASKKIIFEDKLDAMSIDNLIGEIKKKFFKAISHPGESVGSMAAQSIGEPTTQMTLNTFHFAGSSDRNVTLGVPRLQELLNASKNIKTPSMQIYFHPNFKMQFLVSKDDKKNENLEQKEKVNSIQEFQESLLPTQLVNFISKTEIYYDPDPQNSIIFQKRMEILDMELDDDKTDYEPWVLVVYIKDSYHVLKWDKIQNFFKYDMKNLVKDLDLYCTFEEGVIYVRVQKKQFGDIGRQDDDDEDEDDEYRESVLNKLERLEQQILKDFWLIDGVNSITKVMRKIVDSDYLHLMKGQELPDKQVYREIYLETDGSNLIDIFQLPEIDTTRTISNDVIEISKILGIEAARSTMIGEMNNVFDKYSIYVNARHMGILNNWMTSRGTIIPCNRNGVNRIPSVSALRKASFEEMVEMLYEASIYSELDRLRGISEKIYLGQKCNVGTNIFNLYLDLQAVDQCVIVPNSQKQKFEDEGEILNDEQDQPLNKDLGKTPMQPKTPLPFINTPYGGMTPNIGGSGISFTPNINKAEITSPGYRYGDNVQSPAYVPQIARSSNQSSPMNSGHPSPVYSNSLIGSPNQSPKYYQDSPNSPQYVSPQSSNYQNSVSGGAGQYSASSPNYQPTQYSGVYQSSSPSPRYNSSPQSSSYSASYNKSSSPVYKPSYHQQNSPISSTHQQIQMGSGDNNEQYIQPNNNDSEKEEDEEGDSINE